MQGNLHRTVSFGSYRQFFLVAVPEEHFQSSGDDTQGHGQTVADWPRQVRSLLERVRTTLQREGFADDVVMSNFFMADIAKKELVRQILAEVFPDGLGATTFIPQAPANGFAVAVEIWAIGNQDSNEPGIVSPVQQASDKKRASKIYREGPLPGRVVVLEFDGMRWFFGGDMRPGSLPIGAYRRSYDAFSRLGDQLKQNRFSVDQLVRTWIYQGHLVLPEGETQRYKELNRARTDFFSGVDFIKRYLPDMYRGDVYPASTGIGADDVDVVIGAVAIATDRKAGTETLLAVPLENPNQTSAFDYGTAYSPQSPKFARAMAIAPGNDSCLIFVSGTASITESESRHIEDPAGQTELTLDNIAALIDGKNLERHGIAGFRCGLSDLKCVRVYVKRPTEFETIKSVCQKRLGDDIPILYTIADVCRPELLVEIEGFAVTTI